MTELADHLYEAGYEIIIVSAFEGRDALAPTDARSSILNRYRLEHVPYRGSRLVGLMVKLKRTMGRAASALHSSRTNKKAKLGSRGGSASVSPRSQIYETFFALVHTIDDKKRWALAAARKVSRLLAQSGDAVVVVSSPPHSAFVAALTVSRRKVPVVVDLRDPLYYPSGADPARAEPGSLSRFELAIRRIIERFAIKHAAAIVTTSPSLRNHLRALDERANERVFCIPNGYDGRPSAARKFTDHRLVMVYAGTLYLNRNPFPLLEELDQMITERTVDESRIEVVFAGDCTQYGGVQLRDWLSGRPCGRVVTVSGHLDGDHLLGLYERATLLLNFAEGQPMQVPAKTFELLARGREILLFCEKDSDTALAIRNAPGVHVANSGDRAGLRALLTELHQRHVIEGVLRPPPMEAVTQYSRAVQNERFAALIASLGANCNVRAADESGLSPP